MNEELKKSIVRIDVQGSRGTGFVVSFVRENSKPGCATVQVLTALHVVAHMENSRQSGFPMWRGDAAKVRLRSGVELLFPLKEASTNLPDDWALLHFEGSVKEDIPPARLLRVADRCKQGSVVWRTFGYSAATPEEGETESGDIRDFDGPIELFSQEAAAGSGGFVSGLSGAPCEFQGHVVGIIIQAVQDRQGRSVNGKLYAYPIDSVAEACDLELAPGKQDFEADVEEALWNVRGEMLVRLAKSLNVPAMEDEAALRLHTARALILARGASLNEALGCCAGRLTGADNVVDMVYAGEIEAASAEKVRGCHMDGSPKGIAVIATTELTARLLVLRALREYGKLQDSFTHVTSGAGDANSWSRTIRLALIGLLRLHPDEVPNDQALNEEILRWGKIIIGVPFNGWVNPLDEIERYPQTRALALLSATAAATFTRSGYEIVRPVRDPATEAAIRSSHFTSTRRAKRS